MPFEIRNLEGKKIRDYILNQQAVELWGTKIITHQERKEPPYVTVAPLENDDGENWHNNIGFAIEYPNLIRAFDQKTAQQDWNQVKHSMFNSLMEEWDSYKYEDIVKNMNDSLEHLKPYYALIDLWESKGYIPVRKI